MVTIVLLTLLPSCGESASDAYYRGRADGIAETQGQAAVAREEGRQLGFKQGYEAARPPAATAAPQGLMRTASLVVMVLGMVKIVLSLAVFVLLLILDSVSGFERFAKMLATSLGMVIVFWLSNSVTVGFSRPLTEAILAPAASTPLGKLITGLVAAVVIWGGLWFLEFIGQASEGHMYVQTAFVLIASAIISVLVPLFI